MSSNYGSFSEVRARLDEILVEVRKKDVPLEKSLDLYEEAIRLANRCTELVDKSDYSEEEAAAAQEMLAKEMSVSLGAEVEQKQAIDEENVEEEAAKNKEEAAGEADDMKVHVKRAIEADAASEELADVADGEAQGEDAKQNDVQDTKTMQAKKQSEK